MSSRLTIPPLHLLDASDNPEHYELLNGGWEKKESVGPFDHSAMDRAVYNLLRPFAKQLGCKLEQEWTVVLDGKKIVPDVTLSYPAPDYRIKDGYPVAPAFLVVESRSQGQRLQRLVDKCVQDHHAMGTPYCWIIDIESETGYECHRGQTTAQAVPVLTAGPVISLTVDRIFTEFHNA